MMLKVAHIVTAACKVQTTRQRQSLSLYYPRFTIMLTTIPHHLTHLAKKLQSQISTQLLILGQGGKDHDKDEPKLKTCPETLP